MVSPTTRTAGPVGSKASQPGRLVDDALPDPEKRGLAAMKTEGPPPPPGGTRVHVGLSQVDDTTIFYNLNKDRVGPLTPELERRIVRKNFWCLLCQTWWIAFLIHLDKSTLGQAATMGIFTDVDMSKAQFNSLFVVFYAGYLIALWPGAWLSQRVGQKWFITGSLLMWAFLLGMHPLVKTGRQLIALRFVLGLSESQIVPSTTVLHQSFFGPWKSPWVQLLWWAAGSFANVLLTMVSYRLITDENDSPLVGGLLSWKWLHIICAVLTFAVCVPLIIFLPESPVDAKWLSTEEKVHTIAAIRESRSGIANSTFNWAQAREAFTDVKSWLFIFHMFFNELPNNTSQQLPLILVGFGFTPAESALLNTAKPLIGALFLVISAFLLWRTKLGTGYTCAISYLPCIIGGVIELTAPWSNKVALVVGTQISTFKPSYLLTLSWTGTTTRGHTKKLVVLSSCVVSAAVANMISPEFWQERYKPRYTLPWAFMTACWVISPSLCLCIRFYLKRENKKRELYQQTNGSVDDSGMLDTGSQVIQVNDEDLDQTDRQDLRFIYPL